MTLSGSFTFGGPRQMVWDLLQDPAVLAKTLPGTQTLTKTGADRYEGVMKVSIGPLTAAQFNVAVTLKDQAPPSRFTMDIDGKGGVGTVRGSATIDLDDESGGTRMTYSSDVMIGGKIASLGQRLMESVGRMMTQKALDALNAELQARMKAGA
jgi:uncharacterized protein